MMGRRCCLAPGCERATVARRLCRRHYQAAWKAGELELHELLPPRERARTLCPPDHRHEQSSTCYIQHQCRCDPCNEANNARANRRARLKAYGRFDTGLVDAAPVREHLLMLGEFGLGYKRVAALAGFRSPTPVRTIIWGRQDPGPRYGEMQKRVKRETAEKILAVRPSVDHLGATVLVPALGAHRRVQALVARGWSLSKIGARIGMNPQNISALMRRDQVQAESFRRIRDLYEELWNVAPPEASHADRVAASRARHYAEARAWAPPMAWDDIDLDLAPDLGEPATVADVDVDVDEMKVELAISGERVNLSPEERCATVRRLHGERLSDGQIARRAGMSDRTVVRIRQELGLRAWTIAEQQAGIGAPRQSRRAAA